MQPKLPTVVLLGLAVVAGACGGGEKGGSMPAATGPSPVQAPAPTPAPSPSPSGCSASVAGLPSPIPSRGGRFPFSITIASTCAWSARTDVAWADIAPGSGQGSANVTLNVGENPQSDSRTITMTIGSDAFRVVQAAANCVFTLDPSSQEVADQGGPASITVNSTAVCAWTVTANQGWIRVLTPSGVGGGSVNLDIAPNTGDVRQGTVVIGGLQAVITQRRR